VYRFDVTGATDQLPTVYPNQLVVPPLIVQGSVNGTTWITFGTLIPRTEPVISAGPPATLTLGPATFWWENPAGQPAYHEVIDELSAAAFSAYRNLVYETPGFLQFFRSATPITEIADLNVGSRPASRKKTDRIEDLRAIPWVFSWSLSRIMLPGWYGFGTAVEEVMARRDNTGIELLRGMYQEWPFFRTLLSNMDMLLAKSDISIASRYAELVTDVDLRESIFGRIQEEWHRTVRYLLAITGQSELLEANPALSRSLRNRSPYIDPLNHLQVELLKRYRAGETDEKTRRAILLTLNGIAAGLRNSG